MSKERLEEIKNNITSNEVDSVNLHVADFVWLIKQAERVQELKEEIDEWKDTAQSYYMTNQELREQNKRYREALEEIAESRITIADSFGNIRTAKRALEKEE